MKAKKTFSTLGSRGNVINEGYFIVVSLFIVLMVFAGAWIGFKDSYTDIQGALTQTEAQQMHQDYNTRMPATLDSIIIFVLTLLWVGSIALSFFIDTHPVFFIFTILLLVGVFIVGGILSNTYTAIAVDMGIDGDMPMSYYVFDHLIEFILGFTFSIALSLYAKSKL